MNIEKIFLLLTLGLVQALTISEKTNVTDAVVNIPKDLIVNKGAYYSMRKNDQTTISSGDVLINGAWHVVADNGQSTAIRTVVDTFVNEGIFQFNSLEGGEWSAFYSILAKNFENHGDMYFGHNHKQHDPVVTIVSKGKFNNSGMMVFREDGFTARQVQLMNDGSGNTIYNEGSVCLYNANFSQKANIKGNGCIYLGEGTVFEVDFTAGKHNFDFDKNQKITMGINTGLKCLGLNTYDGHINRRFTISGLGVGRMIFFDFSIANYEYNDNKGELTVYHEKGSSLTFVIGQGYDPKKFVTGKDLRSISHGLPPPGTLYDCPCQKEFPEPHSLPDDDDTCVCEPNKLEEKIAKAIELLETHGYIVQKE